MQIVFYNHNHERYGTYWRCLHLARELVKRGHEVTLVCASGKKWDAKIRTRKEDGIRIVTTPRFQTRWSVHHNGQLLRSLLYAGMAWFSKADVQMAFAVAQPTTAAAAWGASRRGHSRVLVDWDDDWEGGMAWQGGFISWLVRVLERNVPRCASIVTVASPWLFQRACNLGWKEKTILLPNGFYPQITSSTHPETSGDEALLVAVGNHFPGWNEWIAALQQVREEVKDLRVVLLGQIPVGPLPDFIEAHGFVSESEVEQWLARANAALLPMEDTIFDKSRWPIRLGSYLRAGVPVVSNAVGAVEEVLRIQPGHYVMPVQRDASWVSTLTEAAQSTHRVKPGTEVMALTWSSLAEKLERVLMADDGKNFVSLHAGPGRVADQ